MRFIVPDSQTMANDKQDGERGWQPRARDGPRILGSIERA